MKKELIFLTSIRKKSKRITMKVLKQIDTSNWTYKHTCVTCESELEAEKIDIKFHHHNGDQREPGYDSWSAKCPVCSSSFNIPTNKIPKAVQVEIKRGVSPNIISE